MVNCEVVFGAEPGQVQQGFGVCSGEGLGGFGAEQVRIKRVPETWEALVQGQVRFNKVPEKSTKPWCKAKSGSTGSGEAWLRCTNQRRTGPLALAFLMHIGPRDPQFYHSDYAVLNQENVVV
jgi:hypothetical protein